ncbi:MAG: hypothetical protein OXI88_11845 [Gammaproteobacteria bacterium]|nr:hypothetical protein [Gammaproteobacteria bacterium]MDE0286023.1 hypothetical protein [Gammaproteobacteria bacterium]MDE0512467.1 hypothetical protein [Gammaproteobacteria bacterium]
MNAQTGIFGELIGYIVILGFAATIIITLLALAGFLPRVREKYLSWLFSLVIVELAGAGFWFFNETFKPVECPACPEPPGLAFQPPLPATGVYLSGLDGEPVQRTALTLGGVTARTFNDDPGLQFNAIRALELAEDGRHLLVKSQRAGGLQLGRVRLNNLPRNIIDRAMPLARHLALGQYYAACTDYPECTQRRDAAQAAFHLIWVLRAGQASTRQQSDAAVKLFHLRQHLRDCDALMLLADKIHEHRTAENRYPETADIYHTLAEAVDLDAGQRMAAYRVSLENMLRYLGVNRLNSNTEFFRRILAEATDLSRYLGQGDVVALLERVGQGLSPGPENGRYEPLSFFLRNELLQAGDSIDTTFQCPA